jgi:hypothetical protein
MAIDGVPLWIGGGEARHSAENLRMMNWINFRGQEGWITSTAGRCETLLTPGEGVRLLPGPFVINSRYPGGEMQSYFDRIYDDEIVQTTPVPAGGGGRRDLVVMVVKDPYPDGGVMWPLPSTDEGRRNGPYIDAMVVEDVPPNCISLEQLATNRTERNYTAIASARLERPANTATITSDMIKRVNIVVNPFAGLELPPDLTDQFNSLEDLVSAIQGEVGGIKQTLVSIPPIFTDVNDITSLTNNLFTYQHTSYRRWPNEAAWDIAIPPWATHCDVFCVVSNAKLSRTPNASSPDIQGVNYFKFGNSNSEISFFRYDLDPCEWTREHFITTNTFAINSADRGKVKKLEHMVKSEFRHGAGLCGQLLADEGTSIYVQVKFKEKP